MILKNILWEEYMLPGGSTDKFGNYYEGLCTINVICDI